MKRILLLTAFLPLACSGDGESESASPAAPTAESPADPLSALRANVRETAARPEHDAEKIKVAHILVAFQGAQRARVTRSKQEAEARAAELLARIEAGEDFLELMQQNSDDPGPGIYGMTRGAPSSGYYPRGQMAPAFGDTGWRLAVGEVGVAAYDPSQSPFGWHIIKRLE